MYNEKLLIFQALLINASNNKLVVQYNKSVCTGSKSLFYFDFDFVFPTIVGQNLMWQLEGNSWVHTVLAKLKD